MSDFGTMDLESPTGKHEREDTLILPPVADTYAARVSPRRREIIANRIATWFDGTDWYGVPGGRGAVRIIDIASQMKIPLEILHEHRTQELLRARGIELVQYPGIKYVFAYRKIDGEPDGKALVRQWKRSEPIPGLNDTTESERRANQILEFLEANAVREFTAGALTAVVEISEQGLRREPMQRRLKALGVRIRTKGTPGKNGSRRFYSVAK